jgi:hypothetical protein
VNEEVGWAGQGRTQLVFGALSSFCRALNLDVFLSYQQIRHKNMLLLNSLCMQSNCLGVAGISKKSGKKSKKKL